MSDSPDSPVTSVDAADNPAAREFIGGLSKIWWLPLLRGFLLILLGIYAVLQPGIAIAALAQVMGFFLILDGAIAIAAGIVGEVPSRGWTILRGIVAILVGILVFAHPALVAGMTAVIIMYMVAFSAIFSGVVEIVAAIRDRQYIDGVAGYVLGGILSIIFGVLLMMAPFFFGLTMVRIIGIFAIITGIVMITLSFRLKGIGNRLTSRLDQAD
ncbi:HdeD family acid-resistance protein [Allorhodopirellula solitaria]|nr:DUF308 domain-containing protein [Allorhodopirellula solitaria]